MLMQAEQSFLLVVDVQEKLAPAVLGPEAEIAGVTTLVKAAQRLGVPCLASEQYPKGLGPTIAPIAEALATASPRRFEKLTFSACANDEFARIWTELARDQWIVCGMETHVCVWQSVRDLRGRGAAVHLLADAVSSRTDGNWRTGVDLARAAGAVVSSTETAVFDLLHEAGGDDFKALSKLIK